MPHINQSQIVQNIVDVMQMETWYANFENILQDIWSENLYTTKNRENAEMTGS